MHNFGKFRGDNTLFKRVSSALCVFMALPVLKKRLSLLAYAQPLAIAILTYIVASRFAAIGVDALHDGLLFKPALDFAEGKMLFRDTFFHYGALTTLLQAFALKLFGHYLIVIKLQVAFFYALTSCFLWLIWKRLIPQWLATLCGIIYVFMAPYFLDMYFSNHNPNYGWWFLPWSSVYALFFQVLSLYFLIRSIEKNSRYYIAAAGASVALTMWARQPVGALLFVALSFFLFCLFLAAKSARKKYLADTAVFVSAFVVVNAFFVLWLAFNNALKSMWLQTVMFPLLWNKNIASIATIHPIFSILFPAHDQFSPASSYVWSVLPCVCLILLFKTFFNYVRTRRFDTQGLIVFASVMVCLASWGQYYPLLCERHTYWAIAPMIGVCVFFVWNLLKNVHIIFRIFVTLLAVGLLFQTDITRRIQGGEARLGHNYVDLTYPKCLKGMKVPSHDALFFQRIATDIDDYFKRYPTGGVINLSMDALYPAFRENLTNFHPLQMYWPAIGLETLYPDYRAKLEKYAAEKKPIIISHTNPVIYAGYTIRSLGRDMYVTSPADPESSWFIIAFQSVQHDFPESVNPIRNYNVELHYAGKKPEDISSIVIATYDFNGQITGAWLPVSQSGGSLALGYVHSSSVDMAKPLPGGFVIQADQKIQLALTGHKFFHYSTAQNIKIIVTTSAGVRFQQTVAFLPLYGKTPEELINQSLEWYLAGDFRKCIEDAEAALLLRPDSAFAYNNICAGWNALGEWNKAVAAGERAIELDPDNVLARNNLALAKSRAAAKP